MTPPTPSHQPKSPRIERISTSGGWQVVESAGSAEAFHHTAPPESPPAAVWIHRVQGPALVLGSGQPDQLVDRRRAERDGIEVCRRRSGGGLVYINPQTDCWIDVILPTHSVLWSSDVGKAFHWTGRVWAELLRRSATASPDSNVTVSERSERTPLGRVWCFADLGHGEVAIDGAKVVGLSQRRTRTWARIQCLALGSWDGENLRPYVDLEWLVRNDPAHFPSAAELDPGLVRASPPGELTLRPPAELAEHFVAALPNPS